MNFKAILFDMDGVIIDSEPVYWEHMRSRLGTLGKNFPEELFKSQVGVALKESAPRIVKALGLDMGPEEYADFLDLPSMFEKVRQGQYQINLMPGFSEAIEALHKNFACAIATGSPKFFRDLVREKFGLGRYFSAFVSAEEVPKGKPAPDIYLEAARRLDVPIGQCLVIDDAPAGVESGKSAGAYVIAIPNKWTRHLNFDRANHVCSSLTEAASHIKELIQPQWKDS